MKKQEKHFFVEDDIIAMDDLKKMENEQAKKLAIWMHDQYEEISKERKWETQKKCQVKFNDLPKENQEVMIALAKRLLKKKGLNLTK